MRKSYQYRVYPSKQQETALKGILEQCRWVYNQTLDVRKTAWEERKESLSLYDTNKLLTAWKKGRPGLKLAYSQSLQNAQVRVDLAFKAFFRRVKEGKDKVGYPRFKGANRYDSFTYPQDNGAFRFTQTGRLRLANVGDMKIILHRPIEGKVKTCTVRRNTAGKWFVSFSVELPVPELLAMPQPFSAVGVDMGLASFATLSNGEKIENPRFFRRDEQDLKRASRKLSEQPRGTPERNTARKIVSHIHERIRNRRYNFIHQESCKLVNRFDVVCLEDLNIRGMLQNHHLAKSISDVAWGMFAQATLYKAADAGKRGMQIDPRRTSQECSACGSLQVMDLATRIYHCQTCGHTQDRDWNAAINIVRRGLASAGLPPRIPRSLSVGVVTKPPR